MSFCTTCGSPLASAAFCGSCGAPAVRAAAPPPVAPPVAPPPAVAPPPGPVAAPRPRRGLLLVLALGLLALAGGAWGWHEVAARQTTSPPAVAAPEAGGAAGQPGATSALPSAPVTAESLQGLLRSGTEAVAGVHVSVATPDGPSFGDAVSGADGKFSLDAPPNHAAECGS